MTNELVSTILPLVVDLAVALIGAVFVYIFQKKEMQALREHQAFLALESAVQETWQETVRDLKKAAKDGKLTKDERISVQTIALDKAATIARTQGIELLNVFSSRVARGIIDSIVRGNKKS